MTDSSMRRSRLTSARRLANPIATFLFFISAVVGMGGGPEAKAADLVEVIFVLDNSGSMREHDPDYLTREAVRNLASALARDVSVDGRIGLVLFDREARLVHELTDIKDIADVESSTANRVLARALDQLNFSGQLTNTPAGIERALYEFRENGQEGARRAIVLLTDGKIDTGDIQANLEADRWLRDDLAGESAASGIQIFGIAFTPTADYQLMQALARRTHAGYYRAFEAAGLASVIDDILKRIGEDDDSIQPALANATPLNVVVPEIEPPTVSSGLQTGSAEDGAGLLALVPLALLLGFGALLWQRRIVSIAVRAPAAQLLDVGGHLGESGAAIPLARGVTRIGRDPHNTLVIEDDTISSEHAIIGLANGGYYLEDRRSANGTRLDDKLLEPGQRIQLKGGDHIRLADVDLMFTLAGYVPVGATAFLKAPTSPPPDWKQSQLALDKKVGPAADRPAFPGVKQAVQKSAIASSDPTPKMDAEVIGLDQRLRDEDAEQARAAAYNGQPGDSAIRRAPLSLLPRPEEDAAGVESMESVLRTDELGDFRQCLDYHLEMIGQISPDFASFVEASFDEELRNALTLAIIDLSSKAKASNHIEHKEYTFNRTHFSICGAPGDMRTARECFIESFGGFSRMLTERLQSEVFRKDRCELLVVLSGGCGDSPWVSMSIVPDDGRDPRIDLLSYEFLTTAERHEIELHDHVEASQSGIA